MSSKDPRIVVSTEQLFKAMINGAAVAGEFSLKIDNLPAGFKDLNSQPVAAETNMQVSQENIDLAFSQMAVLLAAFSARSVSKEKDVDNLRRSLYNEGLHNKSIFPFFVEILKQWRDGSDLKVLADVLNHAYQLGLHEIAETDFLNQREQRARLNQSAAWMAAPEEWEDMLPEFILSSEAISAAWRIGRVAANELIKSEKFQQVVKGFNSTTAPFAASQDEQAKQLGEVLMSTVVLATLNFAELVYGLSGLAERYAAADQKNKSICLAGPISVLIHEIQQLSVLAMCTDLITSGEIDARQLERLITWLDKVPVKSSWLKNRNSSKAFHPLESDKLDIIDFVIPALKNALVFNHKAADCLLAQQKISASLAKSESITQIDEVVTASAMQYAYNTKFKLQLLLDEQAGLFTELDLRPNLESPLIKIWRINASTKQNLTGDLMLTPKGELIFYNYLQSVPFNDVLADLCFPNMPEIKAMSAVLKQLVDKTMHLFRFWEKEGSQVFQRVEELPKEMTLRFIADNILEIGVKSNESESFLNLLLEAEIEQTGLSPRPNQQDICLFRLRLKEADSPQPAAAEPIQPVLTDVVDRSQEILREELHHAIRDAGLKFKDFQKFLEREFGVEFSVDRGKGGHNAFLYKGRTFAVAKSVRGLNQLVDEQFAKEAIIELGIDIEQAIEKLKK